MSHTISRCDQDCRYSCLIEDGWSEYTIEGERFHCLIDAHPEEESFDVFYGEDERLKYAEVCPYFTPGDPLFVDYGKEWYEEISDGLREEVNRIRRADGNREI